ncbi:MAG: hypothetical protein EG828_15555 [Deltaproteobacteria bacterium]|nr:hypothetical protein [Deltaproteobacteria bacterium]
MTRLFTYAFLVILIGTVMALFFRSIDAAIEVDSLKSEIQLQKKGLQFLQGVANDALSSCRTTVAVFENTARLNGHSVLWQGETALVGPFKVTKANSCIERIEAVGL